MYSKKGRSLHTPESIKIKSTAVELIRKAIKNYKSEVNDILINILCIKGIQSIGEIDKESLNHIKSIIGKVEHRTKKEIWRKIKYILIESDRVREETKKIIKKIK